MKQPQQKKENLWNTLLNEHSRTQGFQNTNLLILGRKYAGKRTLIDSVSDLYKNALMKKSQQNTQGGAKLKAKGLAGLIDYTFLPVTNLVDPDNVTNAAVNVYMFEEDFNRSLLNLILNDKQIDRTFVTIVLDLQEPWTFMEDLNRWMDMLTEALGKVNLSLSALDEMKTRVEDYVRSFREDATPDAENPQKNEEETNRENAVRIPLREGVLTTNLGLPIMVVVTKSDILEQAEKEKDWDGKFEAIQYSLRQFCITYGATLLFTSSKAKTNINVFYEYILHRLYKFPLKHKSDSSNGESLFIPIGIDDASILKSLFTKYSGEINYNEKVPIPSSKKVNKEELQVEDNQELFKRLKEKQGTSGTSSKPGLSINTGLAERLEDGPLSQRNLITPGSTTQKSNEQLQNFYSKILQPQQKPSVVDPNQLKESAQQELLNRVKSNKTDSSFTTSSKPGTIFSADDKAKISNIIKMTQPSQDQKLSSDSRIQSILSGSPTKRNEDVDNKIKNLLNLSKVQSEQNQG